MHGCECNQISTIGDRLRQTIEKMENRQRLEEARIRLLEEQVIKEGIASGSQDQLQDQVQLGKQGQAQGQVDAEKVILDNDNSSNLRVTVNIVTTPDGKIIPDKIFVSRG